MIFSLLLFYKYKLKEYQFFLFNKKNNLKVQFYQFEQELEKYH